MELDLLPALPIPSEVVAISTAQGTERLVDGGVLEFALHLQVEQEVPDRGFAQAPDRLAVVMHGETPDPREVALAGAGAEISKLDKGGEFLVPILRGDCGIALFTGRSCLFFFMAVKS